MIKMQEEKILQLESKDLLDYMKKEMTKECFSTKSMMILLDWSTSSNQSASQPGLSFSLTHLPIHPKKYKSHLSKRQTSTIFKFKYINTICIW